MHIPSNTSFFLKEFSATYKFSIFPNKEAFFLLKDIFLKLDLLQNTLVFISDKDFNITAKAAKELDSLILLSNEYSSATFFGKRPCTNEKRKRFLLLKL